MRPAPTAVLLLAAALAVASSPTLATAVETAASADDICAPAVNPCVISNIYDVTGPLDFGSRTVQIVTGGRLRGVPSVSLSAGSVEISVGSTSTNIIEADGASGGGVSIGARRSCSGDGTTLCSAHSQCAALGLGTCSAGNSGTLVLNGIISAAGANPGGVYIGAAGDVTIGRRVSASATVAGSYASEIWIDSSMGSVNIDGPMYADAAPGTYDYSSGGPGYVEISAAVDVTIGAEVSAWSPDEGGQISISAGRDVNLNADIRGSSGAGVYANGGYVTIASGRDFRSFEAVNGDPVQEISTDGGGHFYFSGYGSYGWWQSGYGGTQYLIAGGDIEIGPHSNLHSHGGPGARGGYIKMYADETAVIEGTVAAQGQLPIRGGDSSAGGGDIRIRTQNGIALESGGRLDTGSPFGLGNVSLDADGPMDLDGDIDLRGTADGYYVYSNPGYLVIEGNTDVTISGKIRGGGNDRYGWDDWRIEVCRLHLTSTALLDQASNFSNPWQYGFQISIGESMVADAGSRIETDLGGGTKTFIKYRDPKKPPLLNGIITPGASVEVDPSIEGCPVCGNLEIDQGESCDDGNTASGDGCRSDCQDEGCVAATPGFPVVPICDDGVECTADECDPVAHVCRHPLSCEDGIACTVDSCVNDECVHVPNDDACEDYDDCSSDVCSATNGCVFPNLSGTSCEDGDFCTPPGTCEYGSCRATQSLRTWPNSIKTKVSPEENEDKLKASMVLPLASFEGNPAATGARAVLTDSRGVTVFDQVLETAGWLQRDTLKWGYRSTTGARVSAGIKGNDRSGTVKITLRASGVEASGALNQTDLTLSLLIGTDPATDPCMTARSVPCIVRGTATNCSDASY